LDEVDPSPIPLAAYDAGESSSSQRSRLPMAGVTMEGASEVIPGGRDPGRELEACDGGPAMDAAM